VFSETLSSVSPVFIGRLLSNRGTLGFRDVPIVDRPIRFGRAEWPFFATTPRIVTSCFFFCCRCLCRIVTIDKAFVSPFKFFQSPPVFRCLPPPQLLFCGLARVSQVLSSTSCLRFPLFSGSVNLFSHCCPVASYLPPQYSFLLLLLLDILTRPAPYINKQPLTLPHFNFLHLPTCSALVLFPSPTLIHLPFFFSERPPLRWFFYGDFPPSLVPSPALVFPFLMQNGRTLLRSIVHISGALFHFWKLRPRGQ